jgi:arylsulfatase A-like enzyme
MGVGGRHARFSPIGRHRSQVEAPAAESPGVATFGGVRNPARRCIGWISLLVSAAAWVGCGPGRTDRPPSIVLISIDTLRADHLSCFGYERPTPHIDALCRDGVRFDEAHSTSSWTLPAHMSLFTGRFVSQHRVEHEGEKVDDGIGMLAEALHAAGYRTGGFMANPYIGSEYGFSRGFEVYAYFPYKHHAPPGLLGVQRGDHVVKRAVRWLRKKEDGRPFFLFVHLMDPHHPYGAPAPYAGRYSSGYRGSIDGSNVSILENLRHRLPPDDLQHLIDLYDEEIAWTDALIGRLSDALDERRERGERIVVVLTSDHGEEFNEHGSLGHGVTLYREQTHIPLIVSDPSGDFVGKSVATPVRLVDVAPTIADLAGLAADDPFRSGLVGVSLLDHLGPNAPSAPLPVIIESSRGGPRRAAIFLGDRKAISPMTYRWWYRRGNGEGTWTEPWVRPLEVFDVVADPGEQHPLPPDTAGDIVERLREWREETWSGLEVGLRVDPAWEGYVDVGPDVPWADKAQLDAGERLIPVEEHGGRIGLAGLPAGALRLWMPLRDATRGTVSVHSGAGSIAVYDGASWRTVDEGATESIDLSQIGADAHRPESVPPGRSAVLRVRYLDRGDPIVVDPETRDLLEQLGYGS